jgi:hypothetical protein
MECGGILPSENTSRCGGNVLASASGWYVAGPRTLI